MKNWIREGAVKQVLERELNEARREERTFRSSLERQTVKSSGDQKDYDQAKTVVSSLEASITQAQTSIRSLQQIVSKTRK